MRRERIPKRMKKRIVLAIDPDVERMIKKAARERGISLSSFGQRAFLYYLEHLKELDREFEGEPEEEESEEG